MRELKAKLASSNTPSVQDRFRHGQAVEQNDKKSKYTDGSGHNFLNRHTSDPGPFQRVQSASISSSLQRYLRVAHGKLCPGPLVAVFYLTRW